MSVQSGLDKAYEIFSKTELAGHLGISYQAMNRWYDYDVMPCTDFNGETMYAKQIQELTEGKVTIEELCGFIPHPQSKEWKGKWTKKK